MNIAQPGMYILPTDLFVMWTTSLLFVLWRTHSFTTNKMLSSFIVLMFFISIFDRLIDSKIGFLYLIMSVITVFVWMEIPKYTKNRREDD